MPSGERHGHVEALGLDDRGPSIVPVRAARTPFSTGDAHIAVFRMLADGTVYKDLGEGYLDAISKTRTTKQLVRRLEALGFRVAIEPVAA